MHPALFIEEILRIIFDLRCDQHSELLHCQSPLADLASLARTCQAFKEPALDVLWMNLYDLSQLVRCVPSARRVILRGGECIYTLDRDLEPAEMYTVRAYARRVRVLFLSQHHQSHLDPDTLGHLCRTSQTEPLFPNLRLLHLPVVNDIVPLSCHVAVPSLRDITLSISTSAPSSCEEFMRSLSSSSLTIHEMSIRFRGGWSLAAFSDIMNHHIRHWTRLQSLDCIDMTMDIDTFSHLSRTPSLTRLSFTLGFALIDQIEKSNHVFAFLALKFMALKIRSMVSDSKFFSHLRLPALEKVSMYYIGTFPSKDMVRSFAIALQTACSHELVRDITLDASRNPWHAEPTTTLVLNDILPFVAFNLTHMHIELDWIVDLKDVDLLRLASDCPRIKRLFINEEIGWRSAGITPVGLLKVLRLCPSLSDISIAIDTRGYPIPAHDELEPEPLIGNGLGDPLSSGRSLFLHFSDSAIEEESVPALTAFFADCMPSDALFIISSWQSNRVKRLHDNWQLYKTRWKDVQKMAKEMIIERSKHLCSHGEVRVYMDRVANS